MKGDIEALCINDSKIKSLLVPWMMVQRFNTYLAEDILVNPGKVLKDAEDALPLVDLPIRRELHAFVRFVRLPNKIMIRDLRSDHINTMVSLDVIVKKKTYVKPRIVEAAFECARCGNVQYLPQMNVGKFLEPSWCSCNEEKKGVFRLMFEQSTFEDFQKIRVQESFDVLKGGEQPETIDLHLTNDLTGILTPGMHIVVSGILRSVQKMEQREKTTSFDTYVDVVSLELDEDLLKERSFTPEEIKAFEKLSRTPDLCRELLKSFAPSITGWDVVKKALLLQLFSGVTKVLSDGIRVRGDIHIVIVGDPGIAKSKLLMYVCNLSPRSSYVSAQNATAAGLTAAAVKDNFGQESWSIEGGALVMASGGIAAIDEFEKMNAGVRTTLNEPMESGRISIAKAGITTDMPANTSILAAANPVLGRFDPTEPFLDQCNIEPSLRTRFDVIFSLPDVPELERDTEISNHILDNHSNVQSEKKGDELDPEFLRRYIAYSKKYHPDIKPIRPLLSKIYLKVRLGGNYRGITARFLESSVRLSEAAARMRLSDTVSEEDVALASEIMDEFLKSSCMDKSTGRVDMDILTIGVGDSQREKIKDLKNIIEAAGSEGLTFDEIMATIKQDQAKVEKELKKLKTIGEIYEPKLGRYART